ncbi:hypothetical protein JIG36_33180 [Actinoplanes sp. LDG1-06]|uniref:Glycosyltransferase n=1 Tax=Paractinoplanes ovalisporus TaxID=2810368 RepID=A0ABS2AMC1_9ACTN|nr:hypothetical protein [Actinoplanes ovalisporus]MBM2620376.1 hypothetical protein [Actinoplanes ovalisporus]
MRILLGAQSCGFGPISKLTALSRLLPHHHRIFAGVTVAADFAQRNASAFDEVVDVGTDAALLGGLVADCDHVVSVMDAELVFRAYAADRPTMFLDSLLAFWQLRTPEAEIAALCATAPRGDYAKLDAHFAALSPHERIYAAHLLAESSLVQTFPGVPERAQRLRELGARNIHVTGPIVDEPAITGVPEGDRDGYDLLINLGGFKNFLLDYDHHNDYLRLIARWVPDLMADRPEFERIAVCGGGYGAGREKVVRVGGRTAEFRCLPQREFLPAVATARNYMLTPGLTAIHESLLLGQFPMALPEQHAGHVANLESLGGTSFHRLGARFADLIEDYDIPADDFAGTAAIVEEVGRVLSDDDRYDRFRQGMNTRIEAFLAVGAEGRAEGVRELKSLLQGQSFADLVGELIQQSSDALIGGVR